MFSADPMHQIEHSLWGKHVWPWAKTSYLLKGELDELDARSVNHSAQLLYTDVHLASRFMAVPTISKLHHFSNRVCKLKYITAQEQGVVLHVCYCCRYDLLLTFPNDRTSTLPHLDMESAHCPRTRMNSLSQLFDIWLVFCFFPGSMPTLPQLYPSYKDTSMSLVGSQWLSVIPLSALITMKSSHSHGQKCTPSHTSLTVLGPRVQCQTMPQTLGKPCTHRLTRTGAGQTSKHLHQIRWVDTQNSSTLLTITSDALDGF